MATTDTLITAADALNPMVTAADIMTRTPRTCSPFSTVLEAVLIFRDADCGIVPIVDAGRPVGVVTDRDVALALLDHGDQLAARPVSALMSRDIATVRLDDHLDSIIATFRDRAVRRLLVVGPEGDLRGIIAWSDVVPHLTERGMGGMARPLFEGP